MRRTATLSVLVLLLVPATASAVTDNASFTARLQMPALPTKDVPAPLAFTFNQSVRPDPEGGQPDATAASTISFGREIVSNAALFPTCTQAQLDDSDAVPPGCQDAIFGDGIATAYAGTPGAPLAN